MSLAAWTPSSFKFFSICLLLALEALSSADIAHPMMKVGVHAGNELLEAPQMGINCLLSNILTLLSFWQLLDYVEKWKVRPSYPGTGYHISLISVFLWRISPMNNFTPSFPKYEYIKFWKLPIVSPPEDVKKISFPGFHLWKYSTLVKN